MTDEECDRLMQKYTYIQFCSVENEITYKVWLIVGAQKFCITPEACDEEEALWMQKMLGKALSVIVTNEEHEKLI